MSKAVTVPAEETDTFDLDINFENGEGVVVTFTYPKGRGIAAVYATSQISDYTEQLLYALKDDPSVRAKLEEQGLAFDDDEEDW